MGRGMPAKGPGSATPLTMASARAWASARASSSLRQMTAFNSGLSLSTWARQWSRTSTGLMVRRRTAAATSTAEAKFSMAYVLLGAGPRVPGDLDRGRAAGGRGRQKRIDVVDVGQVVAQRVGLQGPE